MNLEEFKEFCLACKELKMFDYLDYYIDLFWTNFSQLGVIK